MTVLKSNNSFIDISNDNTSGHNCVPSDTATSTSSIVNCDEARCLFFIVAPSFSSLYADDGVPIVTLVAIL